MTVRRRSAAQIDRGSHRRLAGVLASPVNTKITMQSLRDLENAKRVLHWAICAILLGSGALLALLSSAAVITTLAGILVLCGGILCGLFMGTARRVRLEHEIQARSSELHRVLSELELAQAETVRRLSMAVEFRDEDTGAHIERIGRFSTLLAEQIGMEGDFCVLLSHAAPLHDVGKVAIPDAILLKPGRLTPDERAIVETHAEEGHRLLTGSTSAILDLAASVALSHHEKWDGSGYPRGLEGETIPIEGRIVAIADVFDALTSDRVYRKAFSVEQAVEMMITQRARHFDPVLLDAFMDVLGSSGMDAKDRRSGDPQTLVESVLEVYAAAIEDGDAETAEAAIMQAIEDGVTPTTLHGQVIAPATSRINDLSEAGEIDLESERLATGITRRILATLYRYMLGGTEPHRQSVLLAGVAGDKHTLGLQMVHDQLAAAGYRTALEGDLSRERTQDAIENHSPELIVLGVSNSSVLGKLDSVMRYLRERHPEIPIMLGAGAAGDLSREYPGVVVLEKIDESVPAVEELLQREPAVG
ncbi:MAG TPA: HD domain-containing phosphohydrolase [Solirubrobacteraceae bacterium]